MQEEKREKFKVLDYYPHNTISYSALTSFDSCPVCFYLRYFCGIKWPMPKAEAGKKFQDALDAKYSGQDYKKIILDAEEFKGDHKTPLDLIEKAYDFDEIVSLDEEYIADFKLGIPVKFIPDILTKKGIVENKYTSGYYNSRMVKKHKQGTLYYWGIKQLLGFEPKVQYQIFNTTRKIVELVDVEKDKGDVAELLTWMDKTLARIKKCYESEEWLLDIHSRFDCDLGKSCPIKYG